MLSRPDGFMLCGILGVAFFSTSELLYPNMEFGLQLIRARPNFYMINDNPEVSLGNAGCSVYTRRIALKDEYNKKRKDKLAYTHVKCNYFENLAKIFIIPAKTFYHNSAFTGSYSENLFWSETS